MHARKTSAASPNTTKASHAGLVKLQPVHFRLRLKDHRYTILNTADHFQADALLAQTTGRRRLDGWKMLSGFQQQFLITTLPLDPELGSLDFSGRLSAQFLEAKVQQSQRHQPSPRT